MLRLTRHLDAVPSFTYVTWALFAAANFSTTAYVQLVLAGPVLAAADGLSAGCCGALIGLALWRRSRSLTDRTSVLRKPRIVQVLKER